MYRYLKPRSPPPNLCAELSAGNTVILQHTCVELLEALNCSAVANVVVHVPQMPNRDETHSDEYVQIDGIGFRTSNVNLEILINPMKTVCLLFSSPITPETVSVRVPASAHVCESFIVSMQNSTVGSLSLNWDDLQNIPLSIRNLTNLKAVEIITKIGIICDCRLAINFYEFVLTREFNATCQPNNITTDANQYIKLRYSECHAQNFSVADDNATSSEPEICQLSCVLNEGSNQPTTVSHNGKLSGGSSKTQMIVLAVLFLAIGIVAIALVIAIFIWRRNKDITLRLKFWKIWGLTVQNQPPIGHPFPPSSPPPLSPTISMDPSLRDGDTFTTGDYITMFSTPYETMPTSRRTSLEAADDAS